MSDIDRVPKAIGANYAVWDQNTTITLCNVPWDNSYKDIVKFPNFEALNDFLDSSGVRHTSIGKNRVAKADEPIKLPLQINEVYNYNYVRVHNPGQKPINGREMYYYYFIIGVSYTTPGVTTIQVQLDVWQTFGRFAQFGSAFVQQGHIGIANDRQFRDYGRTYLTTPEGLDTGADMVTVASTSHGIINQLNCSVAVVCAADLFADPEKDGAPNQDISAANYVQGMVSGVGTYIFQSVTDFARFTSNYAQYPWILNAIKSVTLIPDAFSNGEKYTSKKLFRGDTVVYQNTAPTEKGRGEYWKVMPNFRDFILAKIPDRYRGLKKFLTYPYCAIEMTLFQGSNVVLKPELWNRADAHVAIKSSNVTPGQKLMAYARGYNALEPNDEEKANLSDGTTEYYYDRGDYLENAVVMDNYPTLAVAGDAGNLSLAQNYNSIAQQRKTADWSQQKSLAGNQTSYDQAGVSTQNTDTQAQISRWQTQRSTNIQNRATAANAVTGAITSLGTGGPGGMIGAASGITGAVVDTMSRNDQTNASLAANRASTESTVGTSNYIRDTNKDLADWATQGDYANAIASVNAKVQDTALTPPFAVGAAGGEVFQLTQGNGIKLYFIMKTIGPGEMMRIGEYWLRYGYQINTFIRDFPDDLMVMSNFTYWRLSELYLIATNLPEWVKRTLCGIFEKGVTVWTDPRKMGQIDIANNVPKTGIRY